MKPILDFPPYKLATVYNGSKEWFVQFYYYNRQTKKYIRQKARLKIRGLSEKEKIKMLNDYCHTINVELKKRNATFTYHDEVVQNVNNFDRHTAVADVVLHVSNYAEISDDRKQALKDTSANFAAFINTTPIFSELEIEHIDDKILKLFIAWCKIEPQKRAGKTINKYLASLQFVSEWLHREKLITTTFSTKHLRVSAPNNETGKYPPLTHAEKTAVFEYYKKANPNYYLYILFVYYTCIRPAELHRLKIENIDLEKKTIFVPWYDSKNGLSAYVQLLQPLIDAILASNILKSPKSHFLFNQKWMPSKENYDGDYSSKYWLKHKDRIGLPEKKSMYGLKHSFNVDYIENNKKNIDWEWLRRHNRHADQKITQRYISGLTAYFIDETKNLFFDYNK